MSTFTNHGPTIALHRPQIPPNTGNISRLCVAIQSPLVILGKPAFSMTEKSAKRAGLDHWQHLKYYECCKLREYINLFGNKRTICITKTASVNIFDFAFKMDDILLFGNETHGLPPALIRYFGISIGIPMWGKARSLNLSNSVAICAYEYLRKTQEIHYQPEKYSKTWYRPMNQLK